MTSSLRNNGLFRLTEEEDSLANTLTGSSFELSEHAAAAASSMSEEGKDDTLETGMSSTDSGLKVTIDGVFQRVLERLKRHSPPNSTYRVQFHKDFTFVSAQEIIPYLNRLGISHLYASPYLKARAGSTHGYDVVDHSLLNPELGTEKDFRTLAQSLHGSGMGHILDFVPNHMGVGTDENPWWQDLLENGPSSCYASYFDVDWRPLKQDLENRLLLPVLGDQFGRVLEDQQLELRYEGGTFHVSYFGRKFPLAPRSMMRILKHRLEHLEAHLGTENHHFLEFQSILTALSHLPGRNETEPARMAERHREKEIIKGRLMRVFEECEQVRGFIQENVTVFNGRKGVPDSFDLLDGLLQDQAFRLSFWRVAADEINYRRFFDINELAAVCMENPEVFEKTHRLILQLFDEDLIDGLRIDHADGLYAPADYLWQLQKRRYLQICQKEYAAWCQIAPETSMIADWEQVATALEQEFEKAREVGTDNTLLRSMYLIVEKILETRESLRGDWPVHGTSGYEFLNMVNGLFVKSDSEKSFEALYRRFVGQRTDFDELSYQCKRLIMRVSMAGELNLLGHQLDRISEQNRRSRDFTLNGLTHAIREIVACFPVYRTYTTTAGVQDRDRQYIEQAVSRARRRNPAMNEAVFLFVQDVLLMNLPGLKAEDQPFTTSPRLSEMKVSDSTSSPDMESRLGVVAFDRNQILRFIGRFQQFTGPMMAKAVEDTAYYNYHRLISLNEVGGDPRKFGVSLNEFHQFNQKRRMTHPWAMSTTSTHDTKRGEDTRARIDVLSEIPEQWKEHVLRWARWNKRKKINVDGELAPSRNDEYLLYQTLIGTWPVQPPHAQELEKYLDRLQKYMIKAVREAKVHSSWITPNEAYEKATCDFVSAILSDHPMSAFRTDFEPFADSIRKCGMWNSLSQTVLKLTCPGIPDTYQGTEFWDLCLVDPDNRRKVDYDARARCLDLISQKQEAGQIQELLQELLDTSENGHIKLYVSALALRLRQKNPDLFTVGHYIRIETTGSHSDHVCAFARRHGDSLAIIVVPRWTSELAPEMGTVPIGESIWSDTRLVWPAEFMPGALRNVFTGDVLMPEANASGPLVADILGRFPVAILNPIHAQEKLT